MNLVYKYRAYPTKRTASFLRRAMQLCRYLYNDALQERQGAWSIGQSVNLKSQLHQLPAYKKLDPEYKALPPDWTEEIIIRLDSAYQLFFKHHKQGVRPPRFSGHLNTVKYTRSRNFEVQNGVFSGRKLPDPIRFTQHRELPTAPTSCFIKEEEPGKWYLGFTVDVACESPAGETQIVGIDVGISHFMADSNGLFYDLPDTRGLESKLKRYQRKLARQKKASNRRSETKRLIVKLHGRISRRREHAIHQMTVGLSNSNIVVEKLNLAGLKRGMLSAQFSKVPIGKAFDQLKYKTALKGKSYEEVSAAGTSQTCICGATVNKKLSQRVHRCSDCGLVMDRDLMSAMVIRARSKLVTGLFKTPLASKIPHCQGNFASKSSLASQTPAEITPSGGLRSKSNIRASEKADSAGDT